MGRQIRFVKNWSRPYHSGVRNGFNISWGWVASGYNYKSAYVLYIGFKFNFKKYGIGIDILELFEENNE